MADPLSRQRSVSKTFITHVFLRKADPVDHQEPGKAPGRKASKAAAQEQLPKMQDLPAVTAYLSRAVQELQHTVAQLHARQDLQESQATSAGSLRTRQESDPTPKPLADNKQMSSKELHHFFDNLPQLVSVPKGTKRRPESTPEPTTSKRSRKHTNSKQPQQAASKAAKHVKPDVSQRDVDDVGVARLEHKSAGPLPQLAQVPSQDGTAVQVPASSPVASASKSHAKDASRISQQKAKEELDAIFNRLEALGVDEFFFNLSRIKTQLELELNLKRHASWLPEAEWMLSSLNSILSCISCDEVPHETSMTDMRFEWGAKECHIWHVLEKAVEKRRACMLEEFGYAME
jgi:hypothetical protein